MSEEPVDVAITAEVERVRTDALNDAMTLPELARLKVRACHLLSQPCGGRLGGETTLGELLDDVADVLARGARYRRAVPDGGEGEGA